MTQWYQPFKISEYLKRIFSIINLTFFIAFAALVFAEFEFNWCEHMIGNYLKTLNNKRPETGTVWKTDEQTSNAHTYLNTIVNKQINVSLAAGKATSFTQLALKIVQGQWVKFDKEYFKKLYLNLPDSIASQIIQSSELIWLFSNPDLSRIFCEKNGDDLIIYFLGSKNRVIKQIDINIEKLKQFQKKKTYFKGQLKDIPEFQGRIFFASDFFKAILNLPKETASDLIPTPEILLREKGYIIKAGISNQAKAGYIKLGFEFDNNGEKKVVFIKARQWAVWHISMDIANIKE